MAGQIVMEGFLNIRVRPWLRRLATRAIAIVPAVLVIQMAGENGVGQLLILSQVVLSMNLPFANHSAHPFHQQSRPHGRVRQQAPG